MSDIPFGTYDDDWVTSPESNDRTENLLVEGLRNIADGLYANPANAAKTYLEAYENRLIPIDGTTAALIESFRYHYNGTDKHQYPGYVWIDWGDLERYVKFVDPGAYYETKREWGENV